VVLSSSGRFFVRVVGRAERVIDDLDHDVAPRLVLIRA
jgi:hypothetical protein